ncbi:MFS transporter [Chloroflexota bacterium]
MRRIFSNVFFGWWIVGAAFLIAMYGSAAVFYGFTAMFEPIANEMGWSYAEVSFGSSLRGLEIGLLAPLTGILVDRWGPRRLIFVGTVITAGGLILLSQVTSLVMFYSAFLLMAIGISFNSMTVLMTAVANWFHRKIGLASGVAIAGFGAGGLLLPLMVRLVDTYTWRTTIVILALGMLVIMLPLSLLFRHKPEYYGYRPDGGSIGAAPSRHDLAMLQTAEVNVGVREALKSTTFWRLALAFTYHITVVSAVITHVMPYLSSINVDRMTAGLVATAVPVMSIGGRLGLGWLGDKLNKKKVAVAAFAAIGLGLLCFAYTPTVGIWVLVPFILLLGVGYGGTNTLRTSMTREYFGRASFGSIFGLIVGISMVGSIAGPPLAGWVFDTWGSYQSIWFIFAAVAIPAVVSVLTVTPVQTATGTSDKA